MKSYTDLEQSKKLAKILSIENADMFWPNAPITVPCIKNGNPMGVNIPCWSLAALLEVIPNMVTIWKDCTYSIEWESVHECRLLNTKEHDSLIDACVELIEKLHKEGVI